MEEFNTDRLLKTLGALISVSDADLVDDRKCFPCKSEHHVHYKEIRNCFKQIFDEVEYPSTRQFLNEVEGKAEKFIVMKSKLYSAPKKKTEYKKEVLDMLCSMSTIQKAENYVNIQHKTLYKKALDNIRKCHEV
ncbi:hypothetical protein [Pelagibaculum spongiae]|uniref:Uncharacterized protein n=1 Tax=Pelagibaculum spongiae TaxID=2080658 RepID=A0A2V1GRF1_9GAMM|nr:hypothetical protein [Pelagibaculum spongiae]PVZ62733.1 hypothetical protein DC094_21830 [Pelagibaculum spongiae]PVZ63511.1 hypothetical protein DC094_20715 [Pelagibaculum spongiae]